MLPTRPWPLWKSVLCGTVTGVLHDGDGKGAPGGANGCGAAWIGAGGRGMDGITVTRRLRRQFSIV